MSNYLSNKSIDTPSGTERKTLLRKKVDPLLPHLSRRDPQSLSTTTFLLHFAYLAFMNNIALWSFYSNIRSRLFFNPQCKKLRGKQKAITLLYSRVCVISIQFNPFLLHSWKKNELLPNLFGENVDTLKSYFFAESKPL